MERLFTWTAQCFATNPCPNSHPRMPVRPSFTCRMVESKGNVCLYRLSVTRSQSVTVLCWIVLASSAFYNLATGENRE